jgi:hypothetical protein
VRRAASWLIWTKCLCKSIKVIRSQLRSYFKNC